MGGFGRTGVYRSHYRVSCEGCFHGGVCFCISNLTDNHNVGVKTKSRYNEVFLCDVVGIVLGGTGQRVYHVVLRFSESVLFYEEQLTGAGLNGVDTLIVRDTRKQCVHEGCLTRRGSTCHDYGYAVADAHFEERNHFLGDHATLDEVGAVDSLRMEQTDGYRDTCFLIHNGTLDCRDTSVVGQVSLSNGRGVVDDHATMVQQSLDDVDGVRRTAEVFLQLDHSTVRVGQRNVIPCVDVDLVEVSRTEERSEDGVFHHLRIQAVDELFLCEAVDEEATVKDIFLNIRLELVVLLLVGECRCVVFCDILLCFSKEVIKFNPYHTPPPYLRCPASLLQISCRSSSRGACLAASAP